MSNDQQPLWRPGARIILLDGDDRILLFFNRVPGQEQPESWITPGGALEQSESHEQAARRELWEETGLADVELGPCVWRRRHVWRWDDRLYDSAERFFVVRVDHPTVAPQALGEMERQAFIEQRWWSVAEIAASPDVFIPRDIAELLPLVIAGDLPAEPLEVGE